MIRPLLVPLACLISLDAAADDTTVRNPRLRFNVSEASLEDGAIGARVATFTTSIDAVDTAVFESLDTETAEVLGSVEISSPRRGRVGAEGTTDTALETGATADVTLSFSDVDASGELQSYEVVVEDAQANTWTDGVHVDGHKARVRLADGALRVRVLHEDRDWLGEDISGLSATIDTGTESEVVSLTISEYRQVWKTNDLTVAGTDASADAVDVQLLLGAEGEAPEAVMTSRVDLDPTTIEPGLTQYTVRETKAGDVKLVTWTESDGQAAALEVEIVDNETGEAVLMTTDDTPVQRIRGYAHDLIEFDPGEDPGSYTYLCLIDLLDTSGDPIGEQLEVDLTVPSYDAEAGTDSYDWQAITDSTGADLGSISFVAGADGLSLSLSYRGDDGAQVESANVIFEEPYEGPAPLETEVNLSLFGEVAKWVQKGEGNIPADYTLTTSLVSPEGETYDTTTAKGDDKDKDKTTKPKVRKIRFSVCNDKSCLISK